LDRAPDYESDGQKNKSSLTPTEPLKYSGVLIFSKTSRIVEPKRLDHILTTKKYI